jgi:hypothetical protein
MTHYLKEGGEKMTDWQKILDYTKTEQGKEDLRNQYQTSVGIALHTTLYFNTNDNRFIISKETQKEPHFIETIEIEFVHPEDDEGYYFDFFYDEVLISLEEMMRDEL